MPASIDRILSLLEAYRPAAAEALPRVNAHIHLPPNFSAFDTVDQAIGLAAAQGVTALGASNYYDYQVYADFAESAVAQGIFPLFGLEIITLSQDLLREGVKINDPGNAGKFYICGKGITRFAPLAPDAAALLQTIRDNDSARMAAMTDRLSALFAGAGIETTLNAQAVKERVAQRHGCPIDRVYLQERHLAQAFQEVVFQKTLAGEARAELLGKVFGTPAKAPDSAVGVQNDIRSYLMKAGKPAFVPDTFVDFEHGLRLILALGGIPCYPTLADGTTPITGFEETPEGLAQRLLARGFLSAEFIPNRNQPHTLRAYVTALRAAGLFLTAGTEHNTLDLLPIAPVCVGDAPIPDDLKEIFFEGACVVAAHQMLTLRGEPGYCDVHGMPNTDFTDSDARIRHFAAIGSALLKA